MTTRRADRARFAHPVEIRPVHASSTRVMFNFEVSGMYIKHK